MIETAPGPEDVSPQALPTDPEALLVLVPEVIAERDAAIARCARLEHLLDVARNAQYGRSSEKLDDDQLRFALEDVEQAVAAIEAEEGKANPKKQRERAAARRSKSRCSSRASAAHHRDDRAREHGLSLLPGADARDRRGREPAP